MVPTDFPICFFFESLFTSCLKLDFRCGKLLNHKQVSQESCYSCWSNPLSHHKIIISQAKFRNIPHERDIYIIYIYPYIPMIFPMIFPCLGNYSIYPHFNVISFPFPMLSIIYPLHCNNIVIHVFISHFISLHTDAGWPPPKKISWFIINYNHH